MKINYLNRIRLREDTSQSRDRMHMLMPDFVIERISNFEISSIRLLPRKLHER
jgi:hypothetical protein